MARLSRVIPALLNDVDLAEGIHCRRDQVLDPASVLRPQVIPR
jgi:hypothetical protein